MVILQANFPFFSNPRINPVYLTLSISLIWFFSIPTKLIYDSPSDLEVNVIFKVDMVIVSAHLILIIIAKETSKVSEESTHTSSLVRACTDPEERGGLGVQTPLKNHKNIRFLSNTGPDPLNNHKGTTPAFNAGPSLACQQNAIEMVFRWRVSYGPLLEVFGSLHQLKKKNLVKVGSPLKNLSGSTHAGR